MANRDILVQAFDAFRLDREMAKVAGLEYYQGITKQAAEEEFLTAKFIKVAQMQGKDPWELAYQIANSLDRLEKVANQMPLFRYYLEWADDMEKRAGIAMLRGLGAAAKAGLKGVGRALKPARFRAVGKAPAQSMGQAFKETAKQTKQIQQFGGGSFGRGKKLMKAETGVDPTKLKGPQTSFGGPKPAPTGGPKPAPAGAPAPAPTPAPAAAPAADPRAVLSQGPVAPPSPAQAYAQKPQVRGRRVRQEAAQAARQAGPQGPAPRPQPQPQAQPAAPAAPAKKPAAQPKGDVPVEKAKEVVPAETGDGAAAAPDTGGEGAPLIPPERKDQIINALVGAGVLAAPVAAYQAFKPQQQQQGYAPRY
jgi:hypothetical protein